MTSLAAHRSQHAQYTVHVRHTVPVAGETVTELACWVATKFLFYGLMQCSPYEIKDKLLKALDEDNNVSPARFVPSFRVSPSRGMCSVAAGRAPESQPQRCLAKTQE